MNPDNFSLFEKCDEITRNGLCNSKDMIG